MDADDIADTVDFILSTKPHVQVRKIAYKTAVQNDNKTFIIFETAFPYSYRQLLAQE